MTLEITNFKKQEEEISPLINSCENLEIKNDEEYIMAIEQLKDIKKRFKDLDEARKKITKPQDEAKKEVMKQYNPLAETLKNMEKILKDKIMLYVNEQEKKRQEQMKKTKMPIISLIPKIDGISFKNKWNIKIVDETKVPKNFFDLVLNFKRLEEIINISGGTVKIPGIAFSQEKNISVRT